MNVLKRLIIPKIELTIRYILSELEELEREDTFRLKRVKEKKMQKAKGDGAEEQIGVADTDVVEQKKEKEENSKPVVEPTSAVESKESPIIAEPKEAAEMGDLIVIKQSDYRIEGDAFIPPPRMKTMATITEVEELINGMSDLDGKEENKEALKELSADKDIQASVEVGKSDGGNLETGEWFETPSKTANAANIYKNVTEYNKMDNFEEVSEDEMDTNDTRAVNIPLKADLSVMDLEKRASASFNKSLDSNFYKPTIDDIFSKHDIAMNDSSSLQDISILDHSLVDLESIDFSIDSKGKVILSRHDTRQSSPVLSTRNVDASKQIAINVESIREDKRDVENVIQDSVSDANVIKTLTESTAFDEKTDDSVTAENLIETGIADDEIKLDKNAYSHGENLDSKSSVSIEETEVWTSDTEQIHKDSIPEEFKSAQVTKDKDKNIMSVETKISRSVSDEKLSRISEEDIVETNTSKLVTVTEESKEVKIEEEKNTDGSIVSDKFEDSKSSFHDNVKQSANKMDTFQSITSIKNVNIDDAQKLNQIDNHERFDIDSYVLEITPQEDISPSKIVEATDTEPDVFKETEQLHEQSYLEMDDVVEDKLKPVRSARSSRDLQRDKNQNESSKKSIADVNYSVEISQSQSSKLYVKGESKTHKESNGLDTNVKLSMEKIEKEEEISNDQNNKSSLRIGEFAKKYSQEDLQISKSDVDNKAGFERKTEKESQNLIRTVKDTTLRDNSDELEPLTKKDDNHLESEGNKEDINSSKTMKQSQKNCQDKRESDAKDTEHIKNSETNGISTKKNANDKTEALIEIEKIEDPEKIIKAESEIKRDIKSSKSKIDSRIDLQNGKNSDMMEQMKRNSQIKRQSKIKNTDGTESQDNVPTEVNTRTSTSSESKEYLNKNNLSTAKDVRELSDESHQEKPLNIKDTHEINETVNSTSKANIDSQNINQVKRSSYDKHQNETVDIVDKNKTVIKEIAIDESHDTLHIESISLKIRDSNEISKSRRYSTRGQTNINIQSNAHNKNVEAERESLDKHERETDITKRIEGDLKENEYKQLKIYSSNEMIQIDQKDKTVSEERPNKVKEEIVKEDNEQKYISEKRKETDLKENEYKPLKIQDSNEMIQPEKEQKRGSKEESHEMDKDESIKEDNEQKSDNERSSSGMNKPGKRHSGDDHLKQD